MVKILVEISIGFINQTQYLRKENAMNVYLYKDETQSKDKLRSNALNLLADLIVRHLTTNCVKEEKRPKDMFTLVLDSVYLFKYVSIPSAITGQTVLCVYPRLTVRSDFQCFLAERSDGLQLGQ